jgi:hypothetical protein
VTAIDMIVYDHIRRPSSTTGSKGKYKTNNVISTSLLYVDEIMQLNRKIMMQEGFHSDLLFSCRDSLNTDSRNVFKMLLSEQFVFHREIQKYADLINQYKNLMNRKTKVIFNYRLPYVIWQVMMWMYMLKNNLKK